MIADDEPLLRESFRLLVASDPGCVVVGEAADGPAAVRLARRERPDVVLMDVRMPRGDGIEATREITGDPVTAGVRVLILTMFDLDPYVYAALRAGASGFVLKDIDPADLLTAVHVVAGGHALFAPTVTRRLIAGFCAVDTTVDVGAAGPAGPPAADLTGGRLGLLTRRERQMLLLVAEGLSNAQICEREHIGMATVKTHLNRILAKLGLRDRAQLVIAAYESGLVSVTRPAGGSASTRPP